MKKAILVTGGAGYIGSHMVRLLLDSGLKPVVLDNLSTGFRRLVPKNVPFIKANLKDYDVLKRVFKKYSVESVMHFAAFSVVSESVKNPLKYFDNNVTSFLTLNRVMAESGVRKIILSSTASVYGQPKKVPITESHPLMPLNTYGETKLIAENMLNALSDQRKLKFISLRYFNACGAHSSGKIGEMHDPETHLIPNVMKVLCGKKKKITIFGDDYPTRDGSCIRDYIHVEDLCSAHLKALRLLNSQDKSHFINLGTGKGYTVREVIAASEKVAGKRVRCFVGPRREGDPTSLVASNVKAARVLGWRPSKDLNEMVSSAWKWERLQNGKN